MISEPLLHRMKILVVDDDRMTLTLLEQLLQRHGYSRVMGMTDSREALETCAAFDPDLIVLDLIMPEVDGFAVLEALMRAAPAALSAEELLEQVWDENADPFRGLRHWFPLLRIAAAMRFPPLFRPRYVAGQRTCCFRRGGGQRYVPG